MWDLIVSVPDHCLSFYFPLTYNGKKWKLAIFAVSLQIFRFFLYRNVS